MVTVQDVLPLLSAACPSFMGSDEAEAVRGDPDYIVMLYFVLHLIRVAAEGRTEFFGAVFQVADRVLADGNDRARDLIIAGLVEGLVNDNHYRTVAITPAFFLDWYGPLARELEWVQDLQARQ